MAWMLLIPWKCMWLWGCLQRWLFSATEQILCGWQKAQRTVFILGKKIKNKKGQKGGENGESKCVGSRELGNCSCLFFSVKTAMR